MLIPLAIQNDSRHCRGRHDMQKRCKGATGLWRNGSHSLLGSVYMHA